MHVCTWTASAIEVGGGSAFIATVPYPQRMATFAPARELTFRDRPIKSTTREQVCVVLGARLGYDEFGLAIGDDLGLALCK